METALRNMNIRVQPGIIVEPITYIGTLDYVFDGGLQPNPTIELSTTLTEAEGQPWDGKMPRKSDFEIAMLVLKPSGERHKLAPYAYYAKGEVYPEYRHAIVEHMDKIKATAEQLHTASPRGYKSIPTSEQRQNYIARRNLKGSQDVWEIAVFPKRKGYKPRLKCGECDAIINEADKNKHIKNCHPHQNIDFEDYPDPANTLQLTGDKNKLDNIVFLPKSVYPSRAVVVDIANTLHDFYLRWPHKYNPLMRSTVLALACQRTGNPIPHLMPAYMPSKKYQDENILSIKILVFEPVMLVPRYIVAKVQPRLMGDRRVPDVPSNLVFRNPTDEGMRKVKLLDEDTADDKTKSAISFAKFSRSPIFHLRPTIANVVFIVSHALNGKVIAREAARRLIDYYRKLYIVQSNSNSSLSK